MWLLRVALQTVFMYTFKKTMATPRMNDASWVDGLPRARAAVKSAFVCIHVLAPLRDRQGVAPVVLQTRGGYLRAPAHMEAAFELCLRHLHRIYVPWPDQGYVTPQALLANRAMEALKLPGKYVPTADGNVLVLEEPSDHAESQVHPLQETSATTVSSPSTGVEQMAAQPRTPTLSEYGQSDAESQATEPDAASKDYHRDAEEVEQPDALPPDATKPEGEVEHATEPTAGNAEAEAQQAPNDPIADKTESQAVIQEASKPQVSTLSKKARRRAAQKARRRCR